VNRFARLEQLVGSEQMRRLKTARVTVCGLGAVGGFAVEALARAGVGCLRLVDFDTLQATNLNRQILALASTLGMSKTDVARQRIGQIHPDCQVELRNAFVDAATVHALLDPAPDAVIDAIDGVNSKVELLAAVQGRGLFSVSSMGAACRLDPSAIRVADISGTTVCPLARIVRRRLHRRGIFEGIRCVFSIEAPREPCTGSDTAMEPAVRGRQRQPLGSISYLPAIFGLTAAAEVLRHLLGETLADPKPSWNAGGGRFFPPLEGCKGSAESPCRADGLNRGSESGARDPGRCSSGKAAESVRPPRGRSSA
jgi:tRNA A37 threonylcarbamoyladenosine dehydratase